MWYFGPNCAYPNRIHPNHGKGNNQQIRDLDVIIWTNMVWISQIFGCDILDNYPNQACVRHTETIQTVPIQIELIQITPRRRTTRRAAQWVAVLLVLSAQAATAAGSWEAHASGSASWSRRLASWSAHTTAPGEGRSSEPAHASSSKQAGRSPLEQQPPKLVRTAEASSEVLSQVKISAQHTVTCTVIQRSNVVDYRSTNILDKTIRVNCLLDKYVFVITFWIVYFGQPSVTYDILDKYISDIIFWTNMPVHGRHSCLPIQWEDLAYNGAERIDQAKYLYTFGLSLSLSK